MFGRFSRRRRRGPDFQGRVAVGDVWRYTTSGGDVFRLGIVQLQGPDTGVDYGRITAQFVDEHGMRAPVDLSGAAGAIVPVGRAAEPVSLDFDELRTPPGGGFPGWLPGDLDALIAASVSAAESDDGDVHGGVTLGIVVVAVASADETPEAAGLVFDGRSERGSEAVDGFAAMLHWHELVDFLEGHCAVSPDSDAAENAIAVIPMDEVTFWALIDRSRTARGGAMAKQRARLRAELERLSPQEVAAFAARFHDVQDRAYTWDLWAACSVILGGSTDDLFIDFRTWLIAQGRDVFERAIADADSLAGLPLGSRRSMFAAVTGAEELAYVAGDVYEHLTGSELPPDPHDDVVSVEPAGVPMTEVADGAELRQRLPRLAARFLRR